MVEKKKVTICDICQERVADSKCQLCGKDICKTEENSNGILQKGCVKFLDIKFGNITLKIEYCSDCFEKSIWENIRKSEFWTDEFVKEIREKFVDYIKKGVMLDNLG